MLYHAEIYLILKKIYPIEIIFLSSNKDLIEIVN